MRRRLVALLTVVAAGAIAPAAAQARPSIGFADQKPSMFADPRFVDLGIRQARLIVPWDVLREPSTLLNVDRWMLGARARGVTPLITIDRSRRSGMASRNPTTRVLARQVRRWRQRWRGQVTQISTWNEANINKRPELVAQWYRAILKACPGCTVLGADLVDRSNAGSWARRFVTAAKRTPKVWGLHNYIDTNNFTSANTRRFAAAVTGDIWLTETGGVLARENPVATFEGTGADHAADATSYLLKTIIKVDPKRIKRVYLYSWSTAPNEKTWDSGFIGPRGDERPALRVVRCYLGRCEPSRDFGTIPVPPAADRADPGS